MEAGIDDVSTKCSAEGIPAQDLNRSITRLIADSAYAQDSQMALARWFGAALAIGGTVENVLGWTRRIEAVTRDDVAAATNG